MDKKNRLAVIANDKKYSQHMAEELGIYFKDVAEFSCYGITDLMSVEKIEEEYVILSSFNIFQKAKAKTNASTKILIIDLTLNKHAISKLSQLPADIKALLVNIDYRHCMETITMIYNAGFKEMELTPYYPGCEYDENISIAITAGESALAPKSVSLVIDIEQRCIAKKSIMEIGKTLGVENPFHSEEARKQEEQLFFFNSGFDLLMKKNSNLMEQLNTILKLVPQGILLTDTSGKIYMANNKAKAILGTMKEPIDGFNITEVFPEISHQKSDGKSSLITKNGINIITTVSEVMTSEAHSGNIITLEYFNETENRQHKFRGQLSGQTHKAVYVFEDIIGRSEAISHIKQIAKRMAMSETSICINGESGTGKELFAQSIHNYSNRQNYNFVAVNCSALPENLLESELYGYEEGAFSGAKKGGKIGLFELAHKGTLFLDEIGEMPLQMQAKLLRALEEKKIMKIGGNRLIDVDVRIICATNRNLLEMVEEGTFRSDLYYRLSVLPITIPPLRERKDDIFLLMEAFKRISNTNYTLSEGAELAIQNHLWPGNIRELRNVSEYLANLGKEIINIDDLPSSLRIKAFRQNNKYEEEFFDDWEDRVEREQRVFRYIFGEMEEYRREGMCIGRQTLVRDAKKKHFNFSEAEIRKALAKLNEKGYINSYKGRRGSEITLEGKKYVKNLMGLK